MGEVSQKVAQLSDTEIVTGFRDALVAIYPTLRRLDMVSDELDVYDDFDELVATLWDVLVLRSLKWKYGLDESPKLPPYGLFAAPPARDGLIEAIPPGGEPFRFIEFVCMTPGDEPFSVALGEADGRKKIELRFDDSLRFEWRRPRDA